MKKELEALKEEVRALRMLVVQMSGCNCNHIHYQPYMPPYPQFPPVYSGGVQGGQTGPGTLGVQWTSLPSLNG